MCGRFTLTTAIDELQTRFGFVMDGPPPPPRYNIAPTQPVLAVRPGGGARGRGRRGAMLRWGLLPPWAGDGRGGGGSPMINAAAETAAAKPAFRAAFRRRRCLVLTDGFYEWRRRGPQRTPFYFRQKSGEPMAFAGLWASGPPTPQGERTLSCAILTTAANQLLAPVHHRMPVILPSDAADLWLDPQTESPDVLAPLLLPAPPEYLESREVSPLVNSVRNDGPECIAAARLAPEAPYREVPLFS